MVGQQKCRDQDRVFHQQNCVAVIVVYRRLNVMYDVIYCLVRVAGIMMVNQTSQKITIPLPKHSFQRLSNTDSLEAGFCRSLPRL